MLVTWKSVMITDPNKLERIKRKFAALWHNIFFEYMEYRYDKLLKRLYLLTLHNRRRHFDALFLINVFSGAKFCPSILETVGLQFPARKLIIFNLFTYSSSHCPSARWISTCSSSHCPSAKSVSTANAVSLEILLGILAWLLKA
jgi:hypothetical protein